MQPDQAARDADTKFKQAVEHFRDELKKVHTGRASASMLDGVIVEAYGQQMPLNQVGGVSAPEPQLLQISPYDPNNIQAISAAIRNNQSLGLNPSDDGKVVRIPVPPLTEDRRRDIAKQVGQRQEDCLIGLRNIRRDVLAVIDKAEKAKEIGQDDAKRYEADVNEAMKQAQTEAEAAAKAKETEIMTV